MSSTDLSSSKSNHKRRELHIRIPASAQINSAQKSTSAENPKIEEQDIMNTMSAPKSEDSKFNKIENSNITPALIIDEEDGVVEEKSNNNNKPEKNLNLNENAQELTSKLLEIHNKQEDESTRGRFHDLSKSEANINFNNSGNVKTKKQVQEVTKRSSETKDNFKSNDDIGGKSNDISKSEGNLNDIENSKANKRIQELVKKSAEMRDNLKERDESMEEKFNDLRKRINNSVSFLKSTKNQIENIKFLYQNDMLNMMNEQNFGDCLQSSDQSIQELHSQMEEIQKKLSTVRERAKNVKEAHEKMYNNKSFEDTVSETVNMLNNIGRGDYSDK